MQSFNKFLFSSVCGVAFAAVIASGAKAACDGSGGQCVVTNGSAVSFNGGIYETIGTSPTQTALYASNGSGIDMTGGELRLNPVNLTGAYAAWAENGATIRLDNTKITGWGGIYVDNSTITLDNNAIIDIMGDNVNALTFINDSLLTYSVDSTTTITTSGSNSHAIVAENLGTDVLLHHVNINTSGDQSHGIAIKDDVYFFDIYGSATITTKGAGSHGIISFERADVTIFEQVKITTEGDNSHGLYFDFDGRFYSFDDMVIETRGAGSHALVAASNSYIQTGSLNKNTIITTKGIGSYGVLFEETTHSSVPPGSYVYLESLSLEAQQATAIMAQSQGDNVLVIWNSEIKGANRLVEVRKTINNDPAYLRMENTDSKLFGGAAVDSGSTLWMDIQFSDWAIRHDASGNGLSEVSRLELHESAIYFDAPLGGVYQTLRIGAGIPGTNVVYKTYDNVSITLNTWLNEGGAWSNQFTDRLLIEGDVDGITQLKINEIAGSPGGQTSPGGANLANEGISLVQVSGKATTNSFSLAGGYVTMGGLPYMYKLYAYGPGSTNGAADSRQQQVGGSDHWDFRLQSECIGPCPVPKPAWQVAPQLANYLVASPALFHAGLQDMGRLHQRLGDIRSKGHDGSGEFFLRGYGGDYAYRSNLNAVQYGYDADITYTALQAGGNLFGFETDNSLIRFGLSGSYGDLSFTPNREGSQKTKMDIWTISPYMTWAHDNGGYLDLILSYGGFNGLVTTNTRGRTARLQGNSFTASIEAGMPFALGDKGWSIEPQTQLIYQKLHFDKTQDIDNFAVELGNPEQITLRIGAEIAKNFDKNSKIYSKLNLIHSFHDGNQAWFGDDFEIGRSGTHLEVGLGGQTTLKDKLNLYGEASWQERVSQGGTNGLSLNTGLNFRF